MRIIVFAFTVCILAVFKVITVVYVFPTGLFAFIELAVYKSVPLSAATVKFTVIKFTQHSMSRKKADIPERTISECYKAQFVMCNGEVLKHSVFKLSFINGQASILCGSGIYGSALTHNISSS